MKKNIKKIEYTLKDKLNILQKHESCQILNVSKSVVGDIISNEANRFKWIIPKSQIDLFIGTGANINFELAGKLAAKKLIIADLSIDVIISHVLYYAPLFRISNTKEEFLSHVLGILYDKQTSLKNIFKLYSSLDKKIWILGSQLLRVIAN